MVIDLLKNVKIYFGVKIDINFDEINNLKPNVMKNLFFVVVMFFVNLVYSQVITIEFKEIQTFITPGKLDPFFVVSNPEWSSSPEVVNYKFIIDVNTRNVKTYNNGKLTTDFPFDSYEKKGNVYFFTTEEKDVKNLGMTIITTMIVDVKNNTYTYSFYDSIYKFTRVEVGTKLTMFVK